MAIISIIISFLTLWVSWLAIPTSFQSSFCQWHLSAQLVEKDDGHKYESITFSGGWSSKLGHLLFSIAQAKFSKRIGDRKITK